MMQETSRWAETTESLNFEKRKRFEIHLHICKDSFSDPYFFNMTKTTHSTVGEITQ